MQLLANILVPLLLGGQAFAGLFDSSSSTTTASSSTSTSTSSTTNDEVAFLETLQAAEISTMSCLISLVNMTTAAIGTCLDLTSLASLIIEPTTSDNSSTDFSTQLNTYLGTVCSYTCADSDIADAQSQLEVCDSSNTLVSVLDNILDNYSTSYKTLACSVHYNGTSDLCLPQVLATSSTANNYTFFDNLVSGTNLDQYRNSVFINASCTGCMYEMFKAAQYTISAIRGQNLTNAFGDHLKNDCPSQTTTSGNTTTSVNWSDVEDQQIPDSLQVSESTETASSATKLEIVSGRGFCGLVWGVTGGILLGGGLLGLFPEVNR